MNRLIKVPKSIYDQLLRDGYIDKKLVLENEITNGEINVYEEWIPKELEAVAVWDDNSMFFSVVPYAPSAKESFKHIAKYYGQLDLRVETLKDAPRYKC